MRGSRIIDLSHTLGAATPVFPGDDPIRVLVVESSDDVHSKGRRSLNCTRLEMSVHTGTHMDAPFHFFGDRTGIGEVALEHCIGPAVLVDLSCAKAGEEIEPRHLAGNERALSETGKVVLHTGWYSNWGQSRYFTDYPMISEGTASMLVECGVHLVGIDTPSVDRSPFPAHLELLGNGVLIIENLTNLSAVRGPTFELIVTPLKITGRDGSPVRAVAREL